MPAITAAASDGFITYQNASLGVKFTYPKNWTVFPLTEGQYYGVGPYRFDDNLTMIAFYVDNNGAYKSSNDTYTTLNYINSIISAYKSSPSQFSNFTLLQNATPATLGGLPAYEIRFSYNYSFDARHPLLLGKQICATRGDSIYGIIYAGPPKYYNRSLSAADQIINSFQFI